MPFPWGQFTFPFTYTCPHCGEVKSLINDTQVETCDCPGAAQSRVLERQIGTQQARADDEAYKDRMARVRRRRRDMNRKVER